jgi:acetolactate synthase I/II/III large subunit
MDGGGQSLTSVTEMSLHAIAEQGELAPSSLARHAEAADLIVAHLAALGVQHIFGVPGGNVEPLYNALARSARLGGPCPVVARHEAGAAYMADGYARETGRLGVCCATSGPGATNLLTGVACAYDNGVGMLVITGQPRLPLFGRRALQESSCTGINTVGMFDHCTRYNTLVSHVDQLEHKLVTALSRLHQKPNGPCHLAIPVDVLRSPVSPRYSISQIQALSRRPVVLDEGAVARLAQTCAQQLPAVVLIGSGCGGAMDLILKLLGQWRVPFVVAPDAKGLVDTTHPLYRGVFGFAGHDTAMRVMRHAQGPILAVGLAMGEWTSAAWSEHLLNTRLIHVDEVEDHFQTSPMASLHVLGNLRAVFTRLLALVHEPTDLPAMAYTPPADVEPCPVVQATGGQQGCMHPRQLMRELSRRMPAHTRYLADAGNSLAWAIHDLNVGPCGARTDGDTALMGQRHDHGHHEPSQSQEVWLRVLMDFAPMGWAIGAAIGVAQAQPVGPVVCITGDGSYLMNGQEITVAAQEGLTVIFVVLNDAALGMVKHGQRLSGAEPIAYELPDIDYAVMCQAMGIAAHVIRSPDDLDALDLPTILNRRGPTLLDVRIDGEAVPPMGLRVATLEARA